MRPLHQTAIAYAKAGFPVFPCVAGGKNPVTKNGFHDATTDLERIDEWWKDNPDLNVAIWPANKSLFVIDIDPGAELSILDNIPPPYMVRTPRKGYHFYFEGVGKTTSHKLAQYVDTRSIGGYVLVPPSVTEHGAYR